MTTPPDADKVLILDFGSQVAQLIARRVREAHVYCELHPLICRWPKSRLLIRRGLFFPAAPIRIKSLDFGQRHINGCSSQ